MAHLSFESDLIVLPVLAVDFGGVINERIDIEKPEPKRYIAGALEALTELTQQFGRDNVYIVSRVAAERERWTLLWHQEHGLFDLTGVNIRNVHFCRERVEKDRIYQMVGATHVIDNRTEVLMNTNVRHKFLFRPQAAEIDKLATNTGKQEINVTWTWTETTPAIVRTLRRQQVKAKLLAAVAI